ncbi:hypothetical protein [Burkholderia sp. BCC1047]|uniref:hypothetical protein n=1 Tax=Burkholderia sp. BCC1047 TaxID=2676299 RepID=UPI001FC8BF05|nr:hypothetical protein [Burkholderia sp. BCC1047]
MKAHAARRTDPARQRDIETQRQEPPEPVSDLPLGVRARHRRHVLSRVFAEPVAQGRITLDERHARVGAWPVHCATGRVTRDARRRSGRTEDRVVAVAAARGAVTAL